MFGEFEQCAWTHDRRSVNGTIQYQLKARYYSWKSYAVFSIEGAVIVTSMNRFYQTVDISYHGGYGDSEYHGTVFVGISFRD